MLFQVAFKKTQLFNKFNKWRTPANWERYRKQRNLTSKLKRQSVRSYLYERCAGGPKSKDFWPTVNPFLSNKGMLKDPVIIIIIIRQPLCPVVARRPQHVVSKLPCLVLSSAISCRSSICPGRLSTAWLVSLDVFSCHMVSKR